MIPLCRPEIGLEEAVNVLKVLHSGWLTQGKYVGELEELLAEKIGVRHAVVVNSCTSALILSLKALGITGEVILPSFTFAATANAVVLAGATPVFADIEYVSCNISPSHVESLITSKTEAIIPVHFAGQSCRMDRIMEIAQCHDLAIIEDSAEALGATFQGQQVGSFGHTGCFSFFPTKNITTGEGGAITTNDPFLADRCRLLRAHGIVKDSWRRDTVEPGYNLRMSDILASIGVAQMHKLDIMNKQRWDAAHYLNMLLPFYGLGLPLAANGCNHVYQMYTVKIHGGKDRLQYTVKTSEERDDIVRSLQARGIEASVHFDPPVHLQDYYRCGISLPITERVSREIITLPMFPSITQEELEYIAESFHAILEK